MRHYWFNLPPDMLRLVVMFALKDLPLTPEQLTQPSSATTPQPSAQPNAQPKKP